MRQPTILENNTLLNAPDYAKAYRESESRLQREHPDLWAYVLSVRGPAGEQPITELPRPGDIIRTNTTCTQLRVVRVYEAFGGHCFETRTLDRNALAYLNGYRLEGGRLLGMTYKPGVAGHNIYNQGQEELFILRRAYQVLPHGRRAVMQATPDLFAGL